MRDLVVALAAVAAVLTGCAAGAAPTGGPTAQDEVSRRVAFRCDDGAAIVVTFQGDAAVLEAQGRTSKLTQQRTASGFHYAGGGQDLRGKGSEITWTPPGDTSRTCQEQPTGQAPPPS